MAQDADIIKAVGKSGEVVVNLTENLAEGSYVFFDNYFSSPELLTELSKRKIHATSTLRADKSRKCPLTSKKEIQKKGRGAYDYRLEKDDKVLICEWFDNKVVLRHSNFDHKLDYMKQAPQKTHRNRQRNIIWFNPPFSKNVKTNIARNFLCLIDKHFPPNHKLHKIFNRNTVKVSFVF